MELLTKDAVSVADDDTMKDLYSVVKRQLSAPAGLSKTMYNLFVSSKYKYESDEYILFYS